MRDTIFTSISVNLSFTFIELIYFLFPLRKYKWNCSTG